MSTELVLLALTLFAIWRTHHLREFHHLYLGALVWASHWWLGPMAQIAGWAITADDAAEHWCEWLPPSPLHWVFAKAASRLPFLVTLGRWLDRVFGGGGSSAGPAGSPPPAQG